MKGRCIISCLGALLIPCATIAQVKTDSANDSRGVHPSVDTAIMQVNSQTYDWRQSPDSNLSVPEAHTVTLSSCPPGVLGKDEIYYIRSWRISGQRLRSHWSGLHNAVCAAKYHDSVSD